MLQELSTPTIYIVSGGSGASGEQLVYTILAQFPEDTVRTTTFRNIREPQQIVDILQLALKTNALVVHTLVDSRLHDDLVSEAVKLQVQALDLMGPVIEWITQKVGREPKGQPGLYRQLHHEYFDRVAAIDYTMAHDDGKKVEDWSQADTVLVGVSRVGKTPLSVYLAVLGWKVANYPLVPKVPVPETLFSLDPRRVIGLTIEPGQLLQYRVHRQKQLGAPGISAYVDPQAIYEEVQTALNIFRRAGFTIVDMTDKAIELGAEEIIRHLIKIVSSF